MKKIIFIGSFMVLLVMLAISSVLGYNPFGGNGEFATLFNTGFIGMSWMASIFFISVMIVFAILVIISALIDYFTNKDDAIKLNNKID